jgi:hypothetical protein
MITTLFNQHADPVERDRGYVGYTAGHALNIKTFTEEMLDRAAAPMFQHIVGRDKARSVKAADDRRVVRGIMRATDKLSDSLLVFRHLNPDHNG